MTRIEKLSIGVAISFTAIGVYERVYGFGFDPATKEIISFAALFVTVLLMLACIGSAGIALEESTPDD